MKRIAFIALAAFLAACGSDNGPTDRFSGTWVGRAIANNDTLNFNLVAGQNGSAVTGNGTISEGVESAPLAFTGTSAPPSVNLMMTFASETLSFTGSYVSSDSVSGIVSEGSSSAPMSLKKQ